MSAAIFVLVLSAVFARAVSKATGDRARFTSSDGGREAPSDTRLAVPISER